MAVIEKTSEQIKLQALPDAKLRIGQAPDSDWAALGGLRFALAFIVFGSHLFGFFPLPLPLTHIRDLGAFAAVLGFFVISGYSISASLERESAHFYERRWTRLYPTYFAAQILACVPFLIWGPLVTVGAEAFKSAWPILGNFFFLGGLIVPPMSTNSPVWSLSVEVVFYCFAPLFFRMPTRILAGLVGLSCAAFWLHDSFRVDDFNTGLHGAFGVIALLWAWLLGFLLRRCPESRIVAPICLVLGCFLLGRFNPNGGPFSQAVWVATVLVVSRAREISLPRPLARPMDYLGELSYPLYVSHIAVLGLVYGNYWYCGGKEVPWYVGVAAATLFAVFLLHAVDLPYRAYARRKTAVRSMQQSDP